MDEQDGQDELRQGINTEMYLTEPQRKPKTTNMDGQDEFREIFPFEPKRFKHFSRASKVE